jgi:hypothetical protein
MPFDIVLTGVGALSPFGARDAFYRAFAGASDAVATARAGVALTDVLGVTNAKLRIARYLDPVAKNAIVALEEAMADAGITAGDVARDPYGYAIVLGATRGPQETRTKAYEQLRARDGKLLSSTLFSNVGYNIAAGMSAIAHGIKGPNLTLAAGSNLSLHLLRRARQLLNTGRVHTVFAGFSESRVPAAPLWQWAYIVCLEGPERAQQRGAAGRALAEIEPAFPEAPSTLLDRRAIRLPHPLPQPLLPEVLAAAETVDLDCRESFGMAAEFLPLIQAGRMKASGLGTEDGHIAFPIRTRSGISLLGVDRV